MRTLLGLSRLLSHKHEFPNAFYRLLNTPGDQNTAFDLTERHFPYFLTNIPIDPLASPVVRRSLSLSSLSVYLKPKGDEPIETAGLTLTINDSNSISNWNDFGRNLREGTLSSLSGSPIRQWTIATGNVLDKEVLDDVLILLNYKIA